MARKKWWRQRTREEAQHESDLLRRYAEALETGHFVDGIEVLRRASSTIEAGKAPASETMYLVTAARELSGLERAFLENLAGGRLVHLPADPPGTWKAP